MALQCLKVAVEKLFFSPYSPRWMNDTDYVSYDVEGGAREGVGGVRQRW